MEWSVQDYQTHADFVSHYGYDVVTLLAPQPHETILDLGCGDGELASHIARSGCDIIAIDASASMVQAAQQRGLHAEVMSGDNITYHHHFDAVFSNAALHWMKNADAVIAHVYDALKPQGRFVAEFGAAYNVQTIVAAIDAELAKHNIDSTAYNPWYFPSQDEYASKLEAAGFSISHIETFERLTPLPTDIAGWLKTFAQPFLQAIAPSEQEPFLQDVMSRVAPTLQNTQGEWFADYVRLRFVAEKSD